MPGSREILKRVHGSVLPSQGNWGRVPTHFIGPSRRHLEQRGGYTVHKHPERPGSKITLDRYPGLMGEVGPGAGLPERLLKPESLQKPPSGAHALAIPCSVVPTRRTGIGLARGILNVPEARASIQAECLPTAQPRRRRSHGTASPLRCSGEASRFPLWPCFTAVPVVEPISPGGSCCRWGHRRIRRR